MLAVRNYSQSLPATEQDQASVQRNPIVHRNAAGAKASDSLTLVAGRPVRQSASARQADGSVPLCVVDRRNALQYRKNRRRELCQQHAYVRDVRLELANGPAKCGSSSKIGGLH